MTSPAPRRSDRQTWSNYTSFGRDYLANALGWPRPQLDKWLLSSTVHEHLVFWHSTCVERPRRYNEAIDWINTGYFDKDCNLEEDVLLLCLGEGSCASDRDAGGVECMTYADQTAQTYKWTTIELWARSVWRIVQDNCGRGAIFEKAVKFHPAAAYGIVFDILAVAFHNIACVGPQSVWSNIINGACVPTMALTPCTQSTSEVMSNLIACQIALDTNPDAASEDNLDHFDQVLDDYGMLGEHDESEYDPISEAESVSVFVETPKKNRGRASRKPSPTAPAKATGGSKRTRIQDDVHDTPSKSKKIKMWVQSVSSQTKLGQDQNNMLNIFDEGGMPIRGYRSASSMQPPAKQQSVVKKSGVQDEDMIVLRRDSVIWANSSTEMVDDSANEAASENGSFAQ